MAPPKGFPKGTSKDLAAAVGGAGEIVRETNTTQRLRLEDPTRRRLEATLADLRDATLDLYVSTLLAHPGVTVLIVKKRHGTVWTKVEELEAGALLPGEDLEVGLLQRQHPGIFRLDPVLAGREVMGSRTFVIGGEEALLRATPGTPEITEDFDQLLKRHATRLQTIDAIKRLEQTDGGDDMKAGDIAALIQALAALRPDTSAAEERARAAEARLFDLIQKQLETAGKKESTWLDALPNVLTAAAPFLSKDLFARAVTAAFPGGAPPASAWSNPETILTIAQHVGPLAQGLLQTLAAALTARPAAPANGHAAPAPPVALGPILPPPADMPAPAPDHEEIPMQATRDYLDMIEALAAELGKPADDRDLPGVLAFAATEIIDPTGQTLAERLTLLAQATPALARLGIRKIDPAGALSADTVWPGVVALLDLIRRQTAEALARGDDGA